MDDLMTEVGGTGRSVNAVCRRRCPKEGVPKRGETLTDLENRLRHQQALEPNGLRVLGRKQSTVYVFPEGE